MKTCFKCGCSKGLEEFYRHPMMADGHVNKCKECNKKDVIANRLAKLERYREYDRQRGNRLTANDVRRYREANPKKYQAHQKVGRAIRNGSLIPKPCEVCGSADVHGHHPDYDKPLDVMWLCAADHKAWHITHGEGLNA